MFHTSFFPQYFVFLSENIVENQDKRNEWIRSIEMGGETQNDQFEASDDSKWTDDLE